MNEIAREAVELITKVRDRRIEELRFASISNDDSDIISRVIEFLLYIKLDMRLYMVSTSTHVEDVWSIVRKDEALVDFVMGLTSELTLMVEGMPDIPNGDWHRLTGAIANAYSRRGTRENTAMDVDTFDRLPDTKDLQGLIGTNPWLATIFLLEMAPLDLTPEDAKKVRRGKD